MKAVKPFIKSQEYINRTTRKWSLLTIVALCLILSGIFFNELKAAISNISERIADSRKAGTDKNMQQARSLETARASKSRPTQAPVLKPALASALVAPRAAKGVIIKKGLDTSSSALFKTSFSCPNATTKVEKKICSEKELADADIEMGTIYWKLQSRLSNADKINLKREQISWLAQRERVCGASHTTVACIKEMYLNRIESLRGIK